MGDIEARFSLYLKRILSGSAEHGIYGMNIVNALHNLLPATSCSDCGKCCNSVSIFSLEYHLVIRDMMAHLSPKRIKEMIKNVLRIDNRLATIGNEKRLRCAFRDDISRTCIIHPVRFFACRLYGMIDSEGKRECDSVRELPGSLAISHSQIEQMQAKVMEHSEVFQVFDNKPPIPFFPFEFWIYRHALGEKAALQIYREILVPASTPLTCFWANSQKNVH